MPHRIRTILFGFIALPICALAGFLAWENYHQYRDARDRAYRDARTAQAVATAQTRQFLNQSEHALRELAGRPAVRALDPAACDATLAWLPILQPAFTHVVTLDSSGRVICSAPALADRKAVTDRRFFFDAVLARRAFTIGKPERNPVTGRSQSTLAYPVSDAAGHVTGMVAASVDLVAFSKLLASPDMPAGAVAGILDAQGVTVARSADAASQVGTLAKGEAPRLMLAQRQGSAILDQAGGDDRIYAFAPVANTDWIIYAGLDYDGLIQPVLWTSLQRLSFIFLLLFLIGMAGSMLARRIVNPIEALSRVMADAIAGNGEARAEPAGPQEIRAMAVQFNSLLDTLSQAGKNLGDSEELFRGAFHTSPDSIVIIDYQSGHYVAVNRGFERLTGLANEDVAGKPVKELGGLRSGKERERIFAALRRDGVCENLETTLVNQAGETVNLLSTARLMSLRGTKCILLVARDVTAQKIAEGQIQALNWALKAHARSTAALIHSSSIEEMAEKVCEAIVQNNHYALAAVALANADDEFVTVIGGSGPAKGYLEALRLSWSEDLPEGQGPTGRAIRSGRSIVMGDALVDPRFRRWRDEAMRYGIRSSVTVPFRATGEHPETVGVIMVYSTQPHTFGYGEERIFAELGEELAFAISVLKDRDMLRQAEETARSTQRELARVARALTVGELASSIAHEINQPLTGIMTNSQTALRWLKQQKPDPDATRAAIERVIRDAERASEVVKRTRSFLAKGNEIHEPVDVNALIAEALLFTADQQHCANVTVQTELAPDLPAIMGDPVQLQQVLVNLAINAIDSLANVHGRPRTLTISSRLGEDGAILISVADNGAGLAPDIADHLFEHFRTTKADGMGLGLAISRSIAEAHAGRLWVDLTVPQGATFHLSLPISGSGAT